jgi:NitT/TauT family transport system substrate-binding protein
MLDRRVHTGPVVAPTHRKELAMILRRTFQHGLLASAVAGLTLVLAQAARASEQPLRFQLDWQFEGPSAMFLLPLASGLFKAEGLDVSVDEGTGSGNAVNRVASGHADMGFADLASVMEFHANNPTAPNKPVAVMMVYNNTPAAVISLKSRGLLQPADLTGKTLGAPVFDAGRRAFPIFQLANRVGKVNWRSMAPGQRERMLVSGEVDAITGFSFSSLPNLEALGVRPDDLVVMPYPRYGVKLYGNAIIVGEAFLTARPQAVRGFLRAFVRGLRTVIAQPETAVAAVQARAPGIEVAREVRRLQLALGSSVATADARQEGFGDVSRPRLAWMASQVADAFSTKGRVDPEAVWTSSFLPSAAERNILPPVGSTKP